MASLQSQIATILQQKADTINIQGAAERLKTLALKNAAKGKSIDDKTYAPYAPSTQRRKKVSAQPVTFRETGKTLDAMVARQAEQQGTVTFEGRANEIMNTHAKGEPNLPKREIFPQQLDEGSPTIQAFTRIVESELEKHFNES